MTQKVVPSGADSSENQPKKSNHQNSKIDGKFYALQHEEWLKTCKELKPAERDVLFYLRTLDPWGKKALDLSVTQIASDLSRDKATVSRALKVLDSNGWIDLELIRVRVRLTTRSHGNLSDVVSTQPSCVHTTVLPPHNEVDLYTTDAIATQQVVSETLTQQEVQNSKNIKINKIELDPFLDPEAEERKSKLKSNDQEPNSNNQELIPNNSLRLKPGEDSSCKQNSLSRSVVPQPALPISAYDRWAATAHPALIFDGDCTPWLVVPQGKTFIRFLEEFIAWGANEFTREYGKSDFYKARADFRSYLLNHPDKVEDKWEQYCSQVTHKAVVMASRVAGGVSVEPEEFQFLLENNQAIANPESLQVDSKVLESVIPQGAEGVASYQLYSSDATQFWKAATEKCSRKMPQVAPCEVPKPELEWLNELIHSGNKSLVDMAIRKAKARGYSINQDGDCVYSITAVEG